MRIYVEPDDQTLKEINLKAKETGIGKAQFLLEAVDQYLHGGDQSDLTNTKAALDKTREDLDKRWLEITTLRSEIATLKADLEKSRSSYEKVLITNQELQKSADQARIDLELAKRDHEHALDTIRQDREQISMLSALTHQLTEKITPALPPSQDEAKKRGWWQFWR